uniref:Uncharacterized protein n=1 Tax=Bacteriophage sp. TaxID=38018 RepID=A0A8D9PEE9_9VIRU|nr:MAG TPA: hypothetical protein [Bacteriophage sp.]
MLNRLQFHLMDKNTNYQLYYNNILPIAMLPKIQLLHLNSPAILP